MIVIMVVIVIVPGLVEIGVFARHEIALCRRRLFRTFGDALLEEHVHEHVHRLRLDDECARRSVRVGVVVFVHAVVVHDRDVAGFPVVADAVVDLEAAAVEDVEDRFVDVPVLLRLAARGVFLEVDVQRLAEAVFGFHVVLGEGLRSRLERDLGALLDARQFAQPLQLVLEAVLTADLADENAFVGGIVMGFVAHRSGSKFVILDRVI